MLLVTKIKTFTMLKITLIVCLSFFLSIESFGQKLKERKAASGWNLVYANDENGKGLAGDLGALIRAIRNGEPVRISWTIEHPTNKSIKVEHFADAKFVTILSDSVVFAQIDPIVGQTPNFRDKLITLKENIEWSFSASTLGNNDSMNTNTRTGEIIDHKPMNCGIKWFIKTH